VTVAAGTLRIGTRGSALALAQSSLVVDALASVGVPAELVTVVTAGDRRAPDTPWGEGAFVTAIEEALLSGEIDAAVHSAKDVPTDEDPRVAIAAFLPRADPLDVVVARDGQAIGSLDELPAGSRVGTDSPRRTAFLLAARPDLAVHPLHGNVDTRLRRLDAGETDVLVLAAAGLERLGRSDRIGFRLAPATVPPAPGQGALAVQVRSDDAHARAVVARLDDPPTRAAVEAERALLAASGGGCRAPVGALGRVSGDRLDLLGGYARPDGGLVAIASATGAATDAVGVAWTLLDAIAARAAEQAAERDAPRVIVTRPAGQSAATVLALVDRGLAPVVVPTIAIEPGDRDALESAVRGLGGHDWIVVTSANAARALADAAAAAGIELNAGGPPRWAAVGRATEAALRAAGVAVSHRPRRATAAALAESLPVETGDRVLLPRGDRADDRLADALRARGAVVETVIAYRTVEAPPSSAALLSGALADRPAAVVMTSGSTVRGLLALADATGDPAAVATVRDLHVIAIGPETTAEARRLGLTVLAEATTQAPGGIADAVAAALNSELP